MMINNEDDIEILEEKPLKNKIVNIDELVPRIDSKECITGPSGKFDELPDKYSKEIKLVKKDEEIVSNNNDFEKVNDEEKAQDVKRFSVCPIGTFLINLEIGLFICALFAAFFGGFGILCFVFYNIFACWSISKEKMRISIICVIISFFITPILYLLNLGVVSVPLSFLGNLFDETGPAFLSLFVDFGLIPYVICSFYNLFS